MRNALGAALAAALLAGAARPAAADWQYTRWGMSPEQVIAASGGAVTSGAPPKGKEYQGFTGRALGTYQGDGARFHAFFHFEDAGGGLGRVALERIDGAPCAALHSGLLERLGKPAKSHRTAFATIDEFQDRAGRTLVRYVAIGELPCTITYDRQR